MAASAQSQVSSVFKKASAHAKTAHSLLPIDGANFLDELAAILQKVSVPEQKEAKKGASKGALSGETKQVAQKTPLKLAASETVDTSNAAVFQNSLVPNSDNKSQTLSPKTELVLRAARSALEQKDSLGLAKALTVLQQAKDAPPTLASLLKAAEEAGVKINKLTIEQLDSVVKPVNNEMVVNKESSTKIQLRSEPQPVVQASESSKKPQTPKEQQESKQADQPTLKDSEAAASKLAEEKQVLKIAEPDMAKTVQKALQPKSERSEAAKSEPVSTKAEPEEKLSLSSFLKRELGTSLDDKTEKKPVAKTTETNEAQNSSAKASQEQKQTESILPGASTLQKSNEPAAKTAETKEAQSPSAKASQEQKQTESILPGASTLQISNEPVKSQDAPIVKTELPVKITPQDIAAKNGAINATQAAQDNQAQKTGESASKTSVAAKKISDEPPSLLEFLKQLDVGLDKKISGSAATKNESSQTASKSDEPPAPPKDLTVSAQKTELQEKDIKEIRKEPNRLDSSSPQAASDAVSQSGASAVAMSGQNDDLRQKIVDARATVMSFSESLKEAYDNYRPPLMKVALELNPASMGSVDVSMVSRGANLQIIVTSNNDAVQMLMQNAQEFRQNLVNLGFSNLSMSFNMGQNSQNGYKNQSSSNRGAQENEQTVDAPSSLELTVVAPKYA